MSNNGYSITSIAYKNLNNKESALLVNALPNYLLLYRLDNVSSRLRKRIFIRQSEHQIRSAFCPFVSSKKQPNACLVCTGSEDCCVYIYDMENDDKPLVNKLQGHSTPVLDVAFNYDQSLLASGDAQVRFFLISNIFTFDFLLNSFPCLFWRALWSYGKQTKTTIKSNRRLNLFHY